MKIIYSKKCAEYFDKQEEENPERVLKTAELLEKKGFDFIEPLKAQEKDILRVHSSKLLESIKYRKKNELIDSDMTLHENIFEYASLSVGGAILAMETCLKSKESSFSLMRPPGHHAGKTAGGFCFFNNIAIAVKKALEEKKAEKVAIIDIDVHAGNGTEEIFLGNEDVLVFSIHQCPWYPYSCLESKNNCFNYPINEGTREEEYLKKIEEILEKVKEFDPDLIGVSAGFDTYKEDPLGEVKLEIETYEKIARMIKNLGKPMFSVLEGGYSNKLPECIYSYLRGL